MEVLMPMICQKILSSLETYFRVFEKVFIQARSYSSVLCMRHIWKWFWYLTLLTSKADEKKSLSIIVALFFKGARAIDSKVSNFYV